MTDRRTGSALDDIRIASPCSMSWERMEGNDQVRYCGQCRKNVYNLSGLERAAAEALLSSRLEAGERLCARLYRRADGTVLTADCPVGIQAARQRAARTLHRVAAAVALLLAGAAVFATGHRREGTPTPLRTIKPFSVVVEWISPGTTAPPPAPCIMGEVALPVIQNGGGGESQIEDDVRS